MSTIDKRPQSVKNRVVENSKEDRLLSIAAQEFLIHGFGRVKMNDLAKLAGISRAALYQLFSSKEQVFKKICSNLVEGLISEIREGIGNYPDTGRQIRFAFEIWAVKNFDLAKQSVEAQELMDLGIESSRDILEQGFRDFEDILTPMLPRNSKIPPEFLAHILSSALRGIKKTARNSNELRAMIEGLLCQCGL
jgi:AcrR family transcriptional regulator